MGPPGAGEPGPMLFARDGSFLLGIRGTGEIAMGKNINADWKRIRVGERPIAGIFDANEKHVYFADLFGDFKLARKTVFLEKADTSDEEDMPSRPSCFVLGKRPWVPGYGCLRRFFPGKTAPPDFGHASLAEFKHFWSIVGPNFGQNVPGPHFSW